MEPSMSSPTSPGMQSSQQSEPSKRMLPLILGAIVIVVVLIVAVFMMKGSSQKSPESMRPGDQETVTKAPVKQDKMYALPQVSVSDWVVPASVSVQAPTTAKLYQFKQNFSAADFRQIADPFFQVDTLDEKPKRIVAYSTQAGASMFYLQKATGSFLFSADKGIPVTASTSAGVTAMTRSMMKDPSLELLGEYDKSNEAGVHYYEFHRSWETMGLPVLNLFGLFNAPSSV
ncbi:hypothetical protein HYS00_02965, partial [Candidatus Microgenomates bacterium]|nr:hypothetical protein [Candidatus Microgenomates bacterium]